MAALIAARNDVHPDGDWWFDPESGESLYLGVDDHADLPELRAGRHVLIPTEPQPIEDLEDFFAEADRMGVDNATIMDLFELSRGKGGFRRFRDRVGASPAAAAWTEFLLAREGTRAVNWLLSRDLVDPASAQSWMQTHSRQSNW